MPPAGASTNPVITPELQQAIMARASGGNSTTPSLGQTAQAPAVPQGGAPAPQPQQQPQQPQQAPTQQSPEESQLIVKALSQRLNSISKVQQQGGKQSLQAMPVGF